MKKSENMNINEKIFLKSICGDLITLIKSNYTICVAPRYEIVHESGHHIKYETLEEYGSRRLRFWNIYFKCNEKGIVRGAYTDIPKTRKPLLWKNPLNFNYNFRFKLT